MKNFKLIILLLTSLTTNLCWATDLPFQSLEEIEKTVQQFVQAKIKPQKNIDLQINVDPLDSRLKLAQCESPIEAFLPQNTRINSRFSVGVRCTSLKSWQLYVPINVAKITQLYVARNALMKGDVIRQEDLRLIKTDINKLRTRPMTDPESIIGMVVRRSIPLGSAFSTRYLELPTVIKKGDAVVIIAAMSGLNIRMTGKAMAAGALGQRIKVKNTSSKRMVEAIVIDSNTVKVSL